MRKREEKEISLFGPFVKGLTKFPILEQDRCPATPKRSTAPSSLSVTRE